MEAACELAVEEGFKIIPEIMIPLVGDWRELKYVGDFCAVEADRIITEYKSRGLKGMEYRIGTMIELPRAALTAGEIAQYAEFFSYGTNDLTQTTYGLSRDDSGLFLKDYLDAKIYEKDPFATLDPIGVGRLIKISIEEGRATRRNSVRRGEGSVHQGAAIRPHFNHQ